MLDLLKRPLRNLRLSVTDRCNLRCLYCMPEADYVWLPREDVLHFEEISILVDVFLALGVDRLRLTGGEPLLRRDLRALVGMLSGKPGLNDLALTTNGILLVDQIDGLVAAGLRRITISLDTLRRDRFVALARVDELDRVKEGLQVASRTFAQTSEAEPSTSSSSSPATSRDESLRSRPGDGDASPVGGDGALRAHGSACGPSEAPEGSAATPRRRVSASGGGAPRALKIDTVVIKGVNDDELIDLIEYGRALDAEVRFIEYMDVGGATKWSPACVMSRAEMLHALSKHYGRIEPIVERSSAPADRFRLPDGATFGIIASTTAPFCRSCDRSRLTADGMWFLCLYATDGIDLRKALRGGASVEELTKLIAAGWQARSDRGAEARLALGERRAFVPINTLRQNPHLEMHTRGG